MGTSMKKVREMFKRRITMIRDQYGQTKSHSWSVRLNTQMLRRVYAVSRKPDSAPFTLDCPGTQHSPLTRFTQSLRRNATRCSLLNSCLSTNAGSFRTHKAAPDDPHPKLFPSTSKNLTNLQTWWLSKSACTFPLASSPAHHMSNDRMHSDPLLHALRRL